MGAWGTIQPFHAWASLIDWVTWVSQRIPHSALNLFRHHRCWQWRTLWILASPRHLLGLKNQPKFYFFYQVNCQRLTNYLLWTFFRCQRHQPSDWMWQYWNRCLCALEVIVSLGARGHLILSFWQKEWAICWCDHTCHKWVQSIGWWSTSCQAPWQCRMQTCGVLYKGVGWRGGPRMTRHDLVRVHTQPFFPFLFCGCSLLSTYSCDAVNPTWQSQYRPGAVVRVSASSESIFHHFRSSWW